MHEQKSRMQIIKTFKTKVIVVNINNIYVYTCRVKNRSWHFKSPFGFSKTDINSTCNVNFHIVRTLPIVFPQLDCRFYLYIVLVPRNPRSTAHAMKHCSFEGAFSNANNEYHSREALPHQTVKVTGNVPRLMHGCQPVQLPVTAVAKDWIRLCTKDPCRLLLPSVAPNQLFRALNLNTRRWT